MIGWRMGLLKLFPECCRQRVQFAFHDIGARQRDGCDRDHIFGRVWFPKEEGSYVPFLGSIARALGPPVMPHFGCRPIFLRRLANRSGVSRAVTTDNDGPRSILPLACTAALESSTPIISSFLPKTLQQCLDVDFRRTRRRVRRLSTAPRDASRYHMIPARCPRSHAEGP